MNSTLRFAAAVTLAVRDPLAGIESTECPVELDEQDDVVSEANFCQRWISTARRFATAQF
jgi:hypothetical protein